MILPTLLNYIDQIARQHPLLNDTGRGDVYDNLNNKENKYPYLNVDVQNSTTNGAVLTYQIYFVVADRLTVDRANEYAIKYDCEGILRTILNALGNTDNIKVENVELEYFTQQFADYLGGVYCTTTIEVPNNFGRCNWMANINVTPQIVTIEPSTEKQTFLPQGGRMIAKVIANPVTAAIDENIKPENIVDGVKILGVEGIAGNTNPIDGFTFSNKIDYTFFGNFNSPSRAFLTKIDDNKLTTLYVQNTFRNCTNLVYARLSAFTGATSSICAGLFQNCTSLKEIHIPNFVGAMGSDACNGCSSLEIYRVPGQTTMPTRFMYGQNGAHKTIKEIEVGKITAFQGTWLFAKAPKLRLFIVGEGTEINLPLGLWGATDVIEEGETGVDELNHNIKTYIADRVADRTGGDALSITFGAALYDVLTDATKQAFTNKNWNVVRNNN